MLAGGQAPPPEAEHKQEGVEKPITPTSVIDAVDGLLNLQDVQESQGASRSGTATPPMPECEQGDVVHPATFPPAAPRPLTPYEQHPTTCAKRAMVPEAWERRVAPRFAMYPMAVVPGPMIAVAGPVQPWQAQPRPQCSLPAPFPVPSQPTNKALRRPPTAEELWLSAATTTSKAP